MYVNYDKYDKNHKIYHVGNGIGDVKVQSL